MQIDKQDLLNNLKPYSTSYACFSKYIEWICDHVADGTETYDLINILARNDAKRLKDLEGRLNLSCGILNVNLYDFIKMFGFTDDLLANDIEKIHDLLAEPLFVIDLDKQGFKPIEKMPSKIKVGGDVQTAADFIATRNSVRYAIEFKTIRTETGIEDGVPFGNSNKSNWWGEMFFNNAVMKIEDKSRRAISQLENTKAHYHCDVKMLVLHSRRLGPSTLLSDAELLSELQKLSLRYPEIDYFCGKLYYGEIAFFPELP